jgi:nitrilase
LGSNARQPEQSATCSFRLGERHRRASCPILFDTPRTLQKLADFAADAARTGAELVVFPEAFLGG